MADELLREAQELVRAEGTTMKSVIEEGLRAVIARHRRTQGFTLRDASVDGGRLRADVAEAGWTEIRDLSYPDPLSADRDFSRFPQIKATNPLV